MGDGALTVARLVVRVDGLLQGWRICEFRRCFLRQRRCRLVPRFSLSVTCPRATPGADQHHQQLERANQRQRGPRADQRPDRAMPYPVRQVGANCGHDPGTQAPDGQPWYRLAGAAGVQYHHGRGPDQPVHRERQQPRRHTRLPMRAHQLERMLVRDDGGDNGHRHHRDRRGDPDEPVRHRPSSSRQPMTNRSLSPYPAASRSARTMAVIAWLRVNKRPERSDTVHPPWPSAAAYELYRAVAITRPSYSAHIKSSSIRAAMRNLTFGSEVRKASDKPSDNGPG